MYLTNSEHEQFAKIKTQKFQVVLKLHHIVLVCMKATLTEHNNNNYTLNTKVLVSSSIIYGPLYSLGGPSLGVIIKCCTLSVCPSDLLKIRQL